MANPRLLWFIRSRRYQSAGMRQVRARFANDFEPIPARIVKKALDVDRALRTVTQYHDRFQLQQKAGHPVMEWPAF
jgi:hypothetical protein